MNWGARPRSMRAIAGLQQSSQVQVRISFFGEFAIILSLCERGTIVSKVPDWIRAAIAAFVLLGIAAFILFRVSLMGLGEDADVVWVFGLLPGFVVFMGAGALGIRSRALSVGVTLWLLVMAFSYLWYFGVSYAVIALYRLIHRLFKH